MKKASKEMYSTNYVISYKEDSNFASVFIETDEYLDTFFMKNRRFDKISMYSSHLCI